MPSSTNAEHVEFVPWDEERRPVRILVRWQWVGLAGLMMAAAVAYMMFAWRPEVAPQVNVAPTVATPTPSVGPPPTRIALTEADLRVEGGAVPIPAAVSEYIHEYFSTESTALHPYGFASVSTYVDWVQVVGIAEEMGASEARIWAVTVRVGLIRLGDQTTRLPVAEYLVMAQRVEGELVVSVPVLVPAQQPYRLGHPPLIDVPPEVLVRMEDASLDGVIGGWQSDGEWRVVVHQPVGPPLVVIVGG